MGSLVDWLKGNRILFLNWSWGMWIAKGVFIRYIIIILGYCWFSRGKNSICLFILSIVCKRWHIHFRTTQLIEIGVYFITVRLIFSSTIGCLGLGKIGSTLSPIITLGLIKNGLSVGQKPDVNVELSFLLTLMSNWIFIFIFTGVNWNLKRITTPPTSPI